MNQNISQQESLSVIMSMIEQAKGDYKKGSGKYSILWGYVVALASVFHFIVYSVEKLHYLNPYVWPVAVGIGVVITVAYVIRDRNRTKVKTYVGYMQNRIWLAFGITVALIYILLWNFSGLLIYPAISLVYTMALFLSASALKQRWMYVPVLVCVGLMILYKFLPWNYQPLIMAGIMIAGNIVPGHIFNCKGRGNV